MRSRTKLPQIDSCIVQQASPITRRPVSRAQLLLAVYPFLIVGLLCVIHVHMRLVKTDLEVQSRRLQVQHRELAHEVALLERTNEQLSDPGRLRVAGRALGMEVADVPMERMYAQVPSNLERKYAAPLNDEISATMVADAVRRSRSDDGVWNVLMNIVDTGKAVASAVRH